MKLSVKLVIPATVLVMLAALMAVSAQQRRYNFIGVKTCDRCHANDAIGNQSRVWKNSPHARAWDTLAGAKARQIAAKHNVSDPQKDQTCLKCHTTGGGRYPATASEGVGCEACHGPGEKYHEFENHASFENRAGAYAKAIGFGMYPIIGIDHIRNREKLCLLCHTTARPCNPEDPKASKEQELSFQGDISPFSLPHPLRR
jgi:hypothetical protein